MHIYTRGRRKGRGEEGGLMGVKGKWWGGEGGVNEKVFVKVLFI